MHLNKKIIFGVVFGVFCLSLLPLQTPVAHAATEKCVSRVFSAEDKKDSANWIDTRSDGSCALGYELVTSTLTPEAQAAQAKYRASDELGCSIGAGGVGNTLAVCISNLVYYIMVGVFSSIAYICAFFFDLAVQLSLNSTTYALGFLTTSWTIIRDLSNMAFIFILIYIAVEVMLTADNSQTLKTLTAVIVVALLVNFSFFFTRVAIDAGNLLALQFYNAIEGRPIGQSVGTGLDSTLKGGSTNDAYNKSAANFMSGFTALASGGGPLTPGNTKDLTASIMDGIQVQNIVNSESFKKYAAGEQSSSMYILITLSTIYIAVGIAFGVFAGAFLFAGAKFIMRIVGLWFVIILSPLALVAATLPNKGANQLFKDWLRHLVNFSFYPAAFLFMFFVLSRFMKELNAGGNFLSGVFGVSSATGLSDGTFGFITILSAIANVGVRLGFVIAMMYLALSAADMLAKSRRDMTSGWARTAAGWMGNAITGGAIGWAGRQTLGRIPALSGRTFDIRNAPGIRNTIAPLLRGYEPMTKTPHGTYGAVPINWGGKPTKSQEKAKAKADRKKDRREDMLDRADIQDEIEARREARRNQQGGQPPQPTPPAGGNTPGGGQRAATPAPAAAPAVANPANQPNQPQPAAQGGATNRAAGVVSASNIQKILQGFNNENLKNMRSTVATSSAVQLTNLKGTIDTSSAKNLAQLKGTIDTSSAKNLSDLKSTVSVSTTNLKSDINNETLDRMKKMVRKVVRDENEGVLHSISENRPPEPPKTPAGGAMRPPRAANDNIPPDVDGRKAA